MDDNAAKKLHDHSRATDTATTPDAKPWGLLLLLMALTSIGLRLSGGYAVEPEQSTLAIVAHHPQAVYFGMKSGFLPKTSRQAADELIAGTERDPSRLSELSDAEPGPADEGAGEGEPAMAKA